MKTTRKSKPKKGPLQVRLTVWSDSPGLQEPRYELRVRERWQPVASLEKAREFAKRRGYPGIHVDPQ